MANWLSFYCNRLLSLSSKQFFLAADIKFVCVDMLLSELLNINMLNKTFLHVPEIIFFRFELDTKDRRLCKKIQRYTDKQRYIIKEDVARMCRIRCYTGKSL